MKLSDFKLRTRRIVYDEIAPYRFSDPTLVDWLNNGLNDLRSKRPDARFLIDMSDSNGTYVLIDDSYDYYLYGDSSGYKYLDDLHEITGWDKSAYPILYFKASSATQIDIYPSALDRTNGTNLMAHALACDSSGEKDVIADNVALGGTFTLNRAITSGNMWNITPVLADIPMDDTFNMAIVYYVASKVYEQDSDETEDQNLSTKYYQRYMGEIRT